MVISFLQGSIRELTDFMISPPPAAVLVLILLTDHCDSLPSGGLVSVKIAAESKDLRWLKVYDTTTWLYLRLANAGKARIILSGKYRDASRELYEISFGDDGMNYCYIRRNGQELVKGTVKIWLHTVRG